MMQISAVHNFIDVRADYFPEIFLELKGKIGILQVF